MWDTLTTYKCVKTLEGHSGIVLALCTHEYVKVLLKCDLTRAGQNRLPVFPRFTPVMTGCRFSHACHRLHVFLLFLSVTWFLHLLPVTCFPALACSYIFPALATSNLFRASRFALSLPFERLPGRLPVFPRLPPLAYFWIEFWLIIFVIVIGYVRNHFLFIHSLFFMSFLSHSKKLYSGSADCTINVRVLKINKP